MTVTPKTKDTQSNKYLLLELFEDTEEKNKLNLQITNQSKFGHFPLAKDAPVIPFTLDGDSLLLYFLDLDNSTNKFSHLKTKETS